MLQGRPNAGYGSIDSAPQSSLYGGVVSIEGNCRALCDRISSQIFSIAANVNSIDQTLKKIGTNKDSSDLRQRLHSIAQTTNDTIKETVNLLRELSSLSSRLADGNRTYKLQWQRLMGEFEETVQRYHTVQKKVSEKVKSSNLPSTTSRPSQPPSENLIGWEDAGNTSSSQHHQEQQVVLLADTSDLDLELLREREEQIRQLEGDILDINQIFRELGMLVHEQGAVIDTIEANVTSAHDNVEQGRDQLIKAATYQMRSRKMKCCLIAILLVVIAIIVIVVVVVVKVK